jgi:hypothetical protein
MMGTTRFLASVCIFSITSGGIQDTPDATEEGDAACPLPAMHAIGLVQLYCRRHDGDYGVLVGACIFLVTSSGAQATPAAAKEGDTFAKSSGTPGSDAGSIPRAPSVRARPSPSSPRKDLLRWSSLLLHGPCRVV